jgi:drug/metabolite transporter (DMT)-like permease
MPLILAGLSALMYGFADFAGGHASSKSHVLSVVVLSQSVGLVMALAAIALMRTPFPARADLLWGAVAGLAGAVGLVALYRGIASSIVAIVSPVSALVGALAPVAFGFALGERLSGITLAGAALCVPAILLLSWSGPGKSDGRALRAAFAHGIAAGLGFGGFFIAISRTSAASGLWPLVTSRCASITLILAIMAASKRKPRLERGGRLSALGSGFADMGANILFLFAARSGLLTLVSVIVSLYPAPTVLLGRVFFRQRVSPARAAGLGLAIAGVALISVK